MVKVRKKSDVRTLIIKVSVNKREHDTIVKLARRSSSNSLSSFVRQTVLGGAYLSNKDIKALAYRR